MMVNLMFQLGWPTVPRYLVKRYSGSFCEGVFWIQLTLNQWTLSKADYTSYEGEPHPIS